MKALILAAGYGTRLQPHTAHTPKPLFPVAGRPLIDITIQQLIDAGVTEIRINVHHLHDKITTFINKQNYPVHVTTCFEKIILGTGGAIKNISDFLDDQPFIVINSDILTDIDIKAVYAYHKTHKSMATLVMHDYAIYNNVQVDSQKNIIEFFGGKSIPFDTRLQAFTGIQVLDPMIVDFIPKHQFISSIDVYKKMLNAGLTIKAYTSKNHYWRDIGSPESYFETVYYKSTPIAFKKAFDHPVESTFTRTRLAGDGSDRKWYRLLSGKHSMIMVDHGINALEKNQKKTAEVASFIMIGQHLYQKKIPVPEIYHFETFSGVVYLQDLGDEHLQEVVNREKNDAAVIDLYQSVIDQVIQMSIQGAEAFDPSWTFQTPSYDKQLILEKECRYFVDAFLNRYLNMNVSFGDLKNEFASLADHALENGISGFMHRDLQSRNIMVFDGKIYFIDFQGGRIGPIQYDLASLITDPYVNLSTAVQGKLLDYSVKQLKTIKGVSEKKIIAGYNYCSVTRILQSLGAFGFLTLIQNKHFFKPFIPIALKNLDARLKILNTQEFQLLTEIVKTALIKILKNNKKNRQTD